MIRAILVDDEPLAREGLRLLLAREDDVEIVGEAAEGKAAVRQILALRPDLVFLDVQMPGMNGFEIAEAISAEHLPAIIFVTAWDQFAVRAFEIHAVDYLVKPVSPERLQDALWRVRRQGPLDSAQRMAGLLSSATSSEAKRIVRDRLPVREGDHYILLRTDQIDWIAAEGNYVRIYAGPRSFLVRGTLADLEQQLDPERFARIHRSVIVNVNRVARITPDAHGDFDVLLTTGQKLRMTRTYRERLMG